MAKQNSSLLRLYCMDGAGTPVKKIISDQMSLTVDESTNVIDTTTKLNDGYEDFLLGLQMAEISCELLVDFDVAGASDKLGYLDLHTIKTTRARKTYLIEITTAGGKLYSQSFVGAITKLSLTAGVEDVVKASLNIKRVGAPTVTVTP